MRGGSSFGSCGENAEQKTGDDRDCANASDEMCQAGGHLPRPVDGAKEAAPDADSVRVVAGELLVMRLQEIAASCGESHVFLDVIDHVEVGRVVERNTQRVKRTDEAKVRHNFEAVLQSEDGLHARLMFGAGTLVAGGIGGLIEAGLGVEVDVEVGVVAAQIEPVGRLPVGGNLYAVGYAAETVVVLLRDEEMRIRRRGGGEGDGAVTLQIVVLIVEDSDVDIEVPPEKLAITSLPPDEHLGFEVGIPGNLDEERRRKAGRVADDTEITIDAAGSAQCARNCYPQ